MKIPFTKAHGALNDFLLSWRHDVPEGDHAAIARAICHRHAGIGADGWMLVDPPVDAKAEGAVDLYNSDGSHAEFSGNGTRCAGAFLIQHGYGGRVIRVATGSGVRTLQLLERADRRFLFDMDMGRPVVTALHFPLQLAEGHRDVTILWVGNPQCSLQVENFDFDWRRLGAEIEGHKHFPNRTNVSFVKVVDEHTIDVRFYERGAGPTISSGSGATGAAVTAVARGLVKSPVRVQTPAGPIDVRVEDDVYLTGPAELTAQGEFWMCG
jgi:diaminopimelate epimerase